MKTQDHQMLEEAYDAVLLKENGMLGMGFQNLTDKPESLPNSEYKLQKSERNSINKALSKYGLDGNGRFGNPSKGVSALSKALDEAGFQLGMVSGDILLGDEGSRLLPYHKYSNSTKEFEEHPEVSNSRIAFNWTKLGTDKEGNPVFEVQTYPS